MGSFTGKAIIVTGASSGLGRAIAVELGAAGAELWLVGRDEAELRVTADQIAAQGGPAAHKEPMDLRLRGPLAALIASVGAAHPHMFALISNAGVMHPEPILQGSVDRWQSMLDVNVMAMLEGCQAAAIAMRAHGRPGHLINIGSLQGQFEEPGVYGISKRAAAMITATLRAELERDDIRVSTVIAGGFATNLARGFEPAQLAKLVQNIQDMELGVAGVGAERVIANPQHLARAVRYILEQPIDVNIQEIVIRPPVSIQT